MLKLGFVCGVTVLLVIGWWLAAYAQDRPSNRPPSRAQIRKILKDLDGLSPADRKARIQELYEKYGKPMRERLTKAKYQPGTTDENTQVYDFKTVPKRNLKIYIDFPPDWKQGDRRPAIVLWHGGGFTQGHAGQFYHQAKYFNKRGVVVARPEYRVRDLDGNVPHSAMEDGISAMRWFKARADEFGIDPDRIVVGGGSAEVYFYAASIFQHRLIKRLNHTLTTLLA